MFIFLSLFGNTCLPENTNLIDTVFRRADEISSVYCLPIALVDLYKYDVYIDNTQLNRLDISGCNYDTTAGYDFSTHIISGGYSNNASHRLDSVRINGVRYGPFMYTTYTELATYLNSIDPAGSWVVDGDRIAGGRGRNYGDMRIVSFNNGVRHTVNYNINELPKGSEITVPAGCHWVVIADKDSSCRDSLRICSLEDTALTNSNNFIVGKIYRDVNNNNQTDDSDIFLNNIKIRLTSNIINKVHLTLDGRYSFLTDTGTSVVKPISNFTHFKTIPDSVIVSHNNYGNLDTINFKLAPTAFVNDASIIMTNNFITRSARQNSYTITYTNESGQTYNGTIKLKLDNRLNFQNATPSPTSIVGDTIVWNINNLPLFTTKNITLNFLASASLVNNDTLKNFVKISNSQTDVTTENNEYTLLDVVRAAYDPNDKLVDKSILTPQQVMSNKNYLVYTIRFQNVGNDTAFNVYIKDTLNNNLDWNSIQPLSSSHDYDFEQINGKYLNLNFLNIQLPDSNVNEALSHGYVSFKIKPKNNLVIGNSISNRASIVFDVNVPIVTNNALTVVMNVKAGQDQTICQGQSIILTATGGTNYTWSNNQSGASITVSPTTTTTYIVTGTVNSVQQKDTVIVNVKPRTTFNNNQSICQGQTYTINGKTYSTQGTYRDTLRNGNSQDCDSIIVTNLTLKPLPNVDFTKIITNNVVQLSAPNGNNTYTWSFGDGNNSSIQNPTHTYLSIGKYYVVLQSTLNDCNNSKTDSVDIISTSISNNISFVDKIEVFPNPTEKFVTIQLKAQKTSDFEINLYSIEGRLVYTNTINNTNLLQEKIDLTNTVKGMYLLKIHSEGEQATYKIMKQ